MGDDKPMHPDQYLPEYMKNLTPYPEKLGASKRDVRAMFEAITSSSLPMLWENKIFVALEVVIDLAVKEFGTISVEKALFDMIHEYLHRKTIGPMIPDFTHGFLYGKYFKNEGENET